MESASDVLRRLRAMAERAMAEKNAADAEAASPSEERKARGALELEKFKTSVWRDNVFAATGSWAAKTVFSENMKQTPALRAVGKWVDDGCPSALVLRGGVGVGKTTAACMAVKRWTEPRVFWGEMGPAQDYRGRVRVTWLRPDQLVSAIMHSYDDKAPQLHKYIVIDDLGRETRAEFVESLCELFDRDGHTILITTNLNKEQMRRRYEKEPRLIDRFCDRAIAIDLGGDSLRKRNEDF